MVQRRKHLTSTPIIDVEIALLRKEDQLSPDLVLRDPYLLDFLNLNDHYVELLQGRYVL